MFIHPEIMCISQRLTKYLIIGRRRRSREEKKKE
jgi:hypothetical protein